MFDPRQSEYSYNLKAVLLEAVGEGGTQNRAVSETLQLAPPFSYTDLARQSSFLWLSLIDPSQKPPNSTSRGSSETYTSQPRLK